MFKLCIQSVPDPALGSLIGFSNSLKFYVNGGASQDWSDQSINPPTLDANDSHLHLHIYALFLDANDSHLHLHIYALFIHLHTYAPG